MKVKLVVSVLVLAAFAAALLAGTGGAVKPVEARELLETALAQIQVPQPGQVAHYSYMLYRRQPPSTLEPSDPYHLPYSEIWPAQEFEDTWIEIGPDGKTARWRTHLRSAEGELLQDLLFDGTIETDYFPVEGTALRLPGEAHPFRDDRVALIEDFFHNDVLSRSQTQAPDGRPVVSVYTGARNITEPQSVKEALSSLSRPFIADLNPISHGIRVDFHPSTLQPVGEAQVVWTKSGSEHVASYRAFAEPEILSAGSPESEAVFQQEVPEEAFQTTRSLPSRPQTVRELPQVAKQVDFPLYAPPEGRPETIGGLHLTATSLIGPESGHVPGFARGIEFAPSTGTAIEMTYVSQTSNATLSLIQAPTAVMRDSLGRTVPAWVQAERIRLELGVRRVPAWRLISLDERELRYIVEAGETTIYLQSNELEAEQLLDFLQALAPVK